MRGTRAAYGSIACLAAVLLMAPPASARTLAEVKDDGTLKIAVYDDFPPYSFVKDGKPEGVDVALGRKLAEALGVEPEFMVRQAGESVDDDLRNNVWKGPLTGGGVADVMLHVPYNQELGVRNDMAVLVGRYFTEKIALLVDPAQVGDSETLALFNSFKIGVELDTLPDGYLSSPYTFGGRLAEQITRYANFDKAVEGLKQKEVAGLLAPKAELEYAASVVGRPVKVVEPPMPGLTMSSWDVGMAVRTNARDLGYALGDTITKMRSSGEMKDLFAKYGLTYSGDFLD